MKTDKRVEVLADKIFGLGYEEDLEGITGAVAEAIAQALIDSGVMDGIGPPEGKSKTFDEMLGAINKHDAAVKEWTE